MAPPAHVVIDLGFGDSGKGKTVDYLVRELGSKLVVRFNGGAQAAHNVITPEGLHHTFSQWGSGTLAAPDVATLLTSDVAIHPIAMRSEAEALEKIGVRAPMSKLIVSGDCLVTTPFHQALNCLRELRRGAGRHGSCGVGFGETVRLDLDGISLHAGEIKHPMATVKRLIEIKEAVRDEILGWSELPSLARHRYGKRWYHLLFDPDSVVRTAELFGRIMARVRVVSESQVFELLREQAGPVVFEGAQGVLLDETHGFAPHTTWSTTTARNALKYAGCFAETRILGVARAYPTRHGAGPFPTEDSELTILLADPRNPENPWQNAMRWGWFDRELYAYALAVCNHRVDGIALTHLDEVTKVGSWKCEDYQSTRTRDVVERIRGMGSDVVIESYGPTASETIEKKSLPAAAVG